MLPVVGEFWYRLLDLVESDVRHSKRFRRGSVERAVGECFGLDRFRWYQPLIAGQLHDVAIPHPLSGLHSVAPTLHLKGVLARTLLDRVSTVQQAMFARKFGAQLGFARRPTPDILDRQILAHSGHQCDVEGFVEFAETVWSRPIPFENLTPAQVLGLRSKHEDFFAAL